MAAAALRRVTVCWRLQASRAAAVERCFGIVPLQHRAGAWRCFMLQHRYGNHWGFPKGHAETGETDLQAARRELKVHAVTRRFSPAPRR